MQNLAELFTKIVSVKSDKVGIICEKEEYTWINIYNLSVSISDEIKLKKIPNNRRIGIFIDHNITQVIALFAVSLCDCVFVIISPLLKHDQINHIICDADINLVITTKNKEPYLSKLDITHKFDCLVIDKDDLKNNKNLVNYEIKINNTSIPSDVACIIYTSGSTGHPKGVVVPHRTLTDGARIVCEYLEITEDDTILSVLPYTFDYGLNQLLSAVYKGARLVIRQYRFPQDVLNDISDYKVTGLAGVPSMWWGFFDPRLIKQSKNKYSSLRYITTAGGKHSKELLDKLKSLFPETEIIIMYGLTESFRSTYLRGEDVFERIGSIGKAVPEVEILVLNESNEKCKVNERGILHHRGALINYGYLNNSELTKEKYIDIQIAGEGCISEKIVRSGDIVSYDEDGFIYFHEREDTLIKSYGYRVSPSQIEEYANMHTEIKQCAVFGLSDDKTGQKIVLAYSTYSSDHVDENKLTLFLKENLPNYSLPHVIKFFKEIPHLPNGKIDYQSIKSSL